MKHLVVFFLKLVRRRWKGEWVRIEIRTLFSILGLVLVFVSGDFTVFIAVFTIFFVLFRRHHASMRKVRVLLVIRSLITTVVLIDLSDVGQQG